VPSASTDTCTSIGMAQFVFAPQNPPTLCCALPDKHYEWEHSVYEGAEELLPSDAPKPLGKPVVMTMYVDANLYHDFVNGRSVTGVLHLFNQTVVDWYSKKQATVETATYGAEFVATRTAMEQIIDLRLQLSYLGVSVKGSTMMFGDNKSVVNSASIPHARLHKPHNALSFHKVREGRHRRIHRQVPACQEWRQPSRCPQ
jgi:hypothetical protein